MEKVDVKPTISVRVTQDIYECIERIAKEDRRRISDVVRIILEDHFGLVPQAEEPKQQEATAI